MELRHLHVFVAVAETGNFTRAAERVNLSQPALTHRIQQLEDEIGAPLFERTSRGARLTPAGESLLPDARRVLADAKDSVRRAQQAAGLRDGVLRVGFDFVEFGSVGLMPSLLGAFRERFPEAEVRLETKSEDDLERALLDDRLDIAFLLGPPERTELRFWPLLQGEYALLLPATHPLTVHDTVPRGALASVRVLVPRLRARDDAALLTGLGTAKPSPHVVSTGAEIAAMTGLVAAGVGVAVLPSGLLTARSGGGTVVRALDGPPLPWVFGMAWRAEQPTPMAHLALRQLRQIGPKPTVI
ncbi:DNA-binding transcriptional LysR family regulator [Deinococcus metalli]|uniref:DNA-binding transcriptional LysR family regulator n=1 Tax=Deinococcus metalli TaxID=1141878 RepID=A0A7W8NQN5_9DEIO|nr:LysR family transcriptional regulator [Deinococcus metalli]MBB5378066.1 DNA-binding transcriptional LysR family regulator [Deinococcus metalli]GHF54165.1 LysR family transcriptional regulator [Deinococcus metalli]